MSRFTHCALHFCVNFTYDALRVMWFVGFCVFFCDAEFSNFDKQVKSTVGTFCGAWQTMLLRMVSEQPSPQHFAATTAGSHQEHRETTTSHAYTNQLSNNVRRRAIADDVTTGIPASPATEHDNSSNNTMPLNYIAWCPSNIECHKLGGDCINCDFDELCAYGKNVTVQCQPKPNINCTVSARSWWECSSFVCVCLL